MAPQLLKMEVYSIKCDVWSLGVLMYATLFGILPWNETHNPTVLLS